MPRSTTVVIGAGIVGCLVASELAARDPEQAVMVIDRDAAGAGASRRSAGLHLPRGSTARVRRMAAYSHAYYATLLERRPELPIHLVAATVLTTATADGFLRGGYLDLTMPKPADNMLGNGLRLADGQAAWQIAGCHYTDVGRFCEAIATSLRPAVQFTEGVAVTGLVTGGDRVIVRTGTGEAVVADQVVLAPGPWLTAPAWRDLIAPLGLRVKKVVALHIEQRPGPADEVVVFDDEDAFLLPVASRGHWLFSYTCTQWDVDPDRLTGGLSAANVEEARACLHRCAPALADAATSGRVCADAYSPSREPEISVIEGTQGRVVFAGGANGSGYRLAPAIAAEAFQVVTEGATDDHQYV